jgi:hypothetical protein
MKRFYSTTGARPLMDRTRDLRSPAQNKYGGQRMTRPRALRGSKFGAGPPIPLTQEQRKAIEDDLRQRGLID